MKKWTMLLALLLATVFCFPGALAEQEAVESTGDNGGGQLVSHVYEPGDIASGLLAQAFGQEHGTMIVAEVRGEGIPLEAEMPDLVLRLGVAFSQGARLELGLRESQENVGFDIALDADAQGLAIASDLLPDERYTMNWETLLGMNLEEMTAGLLGTLEPLMEPYVAIVDEFMQELSVKEFYDVPEEYGFPAVAYEIYITCTHAQAAELLTRLADQLEGDGQLAPVLDVMLASQGLGSAAIVEMMRGAAGSLAQSEGHFVLGAGTNYDAAAEPWYVIVTNTQEDGATDEFSALELPADEILDMNLDRNRGTEAIQWTQTEDGAGVKMTVAEEDGTQAEWSMDCSQAQVWIADLDRNGVKEICVSGDPMSDDDVTWCLTYEAGELKPLPFEGAEYAQGRITGMDAEGMTMAGYVDALGTHMGIRRLTVEDGKLVTVGDGLWHFEYDLQSEETWAQQGLTAKTAVPVTYVDLTGKESRGELAAEIKILITATDGVSRAWFTVQDGRRGYLTIAPDETAGWGYIIGGVGEQALFEGIRYAG